ncbi:hypothetical protein CLOSTMETH_03899 [[Clostridium] methylpentosum DSM 5476]|uniref:Uncharacterized protein n=1 Tax=[Clostridium] methylpentosum DSM 5476 TaxID=537013 RepID=C0EJ53_9FIRM|nr:hypothetical protein CLOSTMETH_03899 [[Clostridium] methylpentosum DSM 5476]
MFAPKYIWKDQAGRRKNSENIVREESGENHRGNYMSGPCAYVCGNTAEIVSDIMG